MIVVFGPVQLQVAAAEVDRDAALGVRPVELVAGRFQRQREVGDAVTPQPKQVVHQPLGRALDLEWLQDPCVVGEGDGLLLGLVPAKYTKRSIDRSSRRAAPSDESPIDADQRAR